MEKAKGCECNLAALCCVHPTVLAAVNANRSLHPNSLITPL